MLSSTFQEAATEVLGILEHTDKKYVEKIPDSFIKFLKENSSKTYVSELDYSKPIKELQLKPKTEAILGLIYMKYWANEVSKKQFEKKIIQNEQNLLNEEKIAFENSIFEEKTKDSIEQQNFPKEYKRVNWFLNILGRIKRVLRR